MSGSRLGRGRGGRLAVYGGCGVVVVLLVFLYRAATSEMARLRELHVQCAHQQEALAAQLQVIFEYKVRLEKSLAEEKSSNAAVKQELQQRASREKSLRDKDSIEAMQRFNSLQQTYKLLQTEHQDLQEECKKREKQASEDTTRLEKALEHLKTKFLELDTEKSRLKEKYDDVIKNSGNSNSTIDHLKKEVMQLKRELEQAKKSSKVVNPSPASSPPLQRTGQQAKSGWAEPRNQEQPVGPSQQQQVSPPNNDDKNPQPLHAPLAHHAIGDPLQSNEQRLNEETNDGDVQFAQKNGNIVPVGPNEAKDGEVLQRPVEVLPQEKQYQKVDNDQSTTSRVVVHNIVTDSVHKTDNPKEQVKSAVPLDENSMPRTSEKVEEKLEKAHNNVDGIFSQFLRMI